MYNALYTWSKMGRDFKPLKLSPVVTYGKDYKATHVSLTMDEYISIMKRIDQYVVRIGELKEKPIVDHYFEGIPMKRRKKE